jgi:hypothetical protein
MRTVQLAQLTDVLIPQLNVKVCVSNLQVRSFIWCISYIIPANCSLMLSLLLQRLISSTRISNNSYMWVVSTPSDGSRVD